MRLKLMDHADKGDQIFLIIGVIITIIGSYLIFVTSYQIEGIAFLLMGFFYIIGMLMRLSTIKILKANNNKWE